jgi:uncharacterized protein YbjT (DUF2867 family)
VARILIVGGGCRGRRLASGLVRAGHPTRITTRRKDSRALIEASGAECWIGDPDRLTTLSGALDRVTVVCWLLASASGPQAQLQALHTSRLRAFLGRMIDTPVRGFVYEAGGIAVSDEALAAGERVVGAVAARNALLVAVVRAPTDSDPWLAQARVAVDSLIAGVPPRSGWAPGNREDGSER